VVKSGLLPPKLTITRNRASLLMGMKTCVENSCRSRSLISNGNFSSGVQRNTHKLSLARSGRRLTTSERKLNRFAVFILAAIRSPYGEYACRLMGSIRNLLLVDTVSRPFRSFGPLDSIHLSWRLLFTADQNDV